MNDARLWLERLSGVVPDGGLRVLNVCGGHERTITMAGLRSVLPGGLTLIPGPGCPVCVCPEEDLAAALHLAMAEQAVVLAFGDMLRVPIHAAPGQPRSLEEARGRGADIHPIASPMEAPLLARAHPQRQVVFFAAGFETTTAPVAAMLAQGVPENLSVLLSGRRTWPAVALLMEQDQPGFDALVAPGHVATVMGPEEWSFLPERHAMPAAIAGFTPESMLAALYSVCRQAREARPFLDNCYPASVRPGGNPGARRLLEKVLEVVPAAWRGIGTLPASGYALRPAFARHDARVRFPQACTGHAGGAMPPGCDCAQVILGRIPPTGCRLYGKGCTPRHPVGPCMVSDEGACRIWWDGGQH